MAIPSKLTSELQKIIGDNIALGLTYSLAAEAAGITYKTFNEYMNRGNNVDAAKAILEHLNETAKTGNCQVCMWILERRFPEDFGRRVYKKNECCI